MTMTQRFDLRSAAAGAALLALAACGGGNGNTIDVAPNPGVVGNLSGTAAVGAPIVGGTVKTVCAGGAAPALATTGASGAWQVALSGQTLPCAVQVSTGTVNGIANAALYHAVATNLGTVNITPLTDLMVANLAASATPATWFAGLSTSATPLTTVTPARMDAALAQLRAALSALTPLATINPLTTAFSAQAGNPIDDMLAALRTAQSSTAIPYATLLTNASQSGFSLPAALTPALAAAFAGTASGGAVALPAAPDGASATVVSATRIDLAWTSVSGATGYNIFRATAPNVQLVAGNKLNLTPVTASPFTDTGVNAATAYYYKVTATNAAGESLASKEVAATTTAAGLAAPVITGIVPVTGPVGTVVKIAGSNFSTTASNNTVRFNGTAAIVSAASATELTVTVPAAATTGAITVAVQGQSAVSSTPFTVAATNTGAGGDAGPVGTQMGGARQGLPVTIGAGAGVVTTFAGSGTDAGTGFFPTPADAIGTAAKFSQPTGLTTDGVNLYVADYNNARIRQIVLATGAVTTLAGAVGFGSTDGTGLEAGFAAPAGITTDGKNLYVVDQAAGNIRKIVIATRVVTTLAAVGGFPYGITTDGVNLYVSELTGNKIDKVVIATGQVSTFAGSGAFGNTSADGTGTSATFVTPAGLTTDGVNLYVAEAGNNKIRKIALATGVVTTLAGRSAGGTADGIGTDAQFSGPYGITTDGTNLFVSDSINRSVRKVVIATGAVSTLAGSGSAGAADGTGNVASFTVNRSIVTDGINLYVGDNGTHTIRKIH